MKEVIIKRLLSCALLIVAISMFTILLTSCKKTENNSSEIIDIREDELTLSVNMKEMIVYSTFQIKTNKDGNVAYTASDVAICSVDKSGKITANRIGNAIITATYGDLRAECSIKVIGEDLVPSITVDYENISLTYLKKTQKGDTFAIKPYIEFNNTVFNNGIFTYYTDNSDVVTVDNNGLITAKSFGSAVVYIKGVWKDFNETVLNKTVKITVNPDVDCEFISEKTTLHTINKTIDGVTYQNQTTYELRLTLEGENYETEVNYIVNNGDTDKQVVSISGGTIRAEKAGIASIVANCTVEGVEIFSKPMVIEVKAPIIEVNSELEIFNVRDNNEYSFENVEGEFVAITLNKTQYNEYVSIENNVIKLALKDNFEKVLGENSIQITTTKYIYNYKMLFITHSVSNGDEFKKCITEKSIKHYAVLTKDITFSVGEFKASITSYSGIFDGQGFTVDASGTKITSSNGLFGRLTGGEIRNLAIINITVLGKENTVLGERVYEGAAIKNVYIQAKYVENTAKDYTEMDKAGTKYYNGLFVRGFNFENTIVNIEYPESVDADKYVLCGDSNVIRVKNTYGYGNATQMAKTFQSECYANSTEFLKNNLGNLSVKNGFNKYWYFDANNIRFGDLVVVEPTADVKEKIVTKQTISLDLDDFIDEPIEKILIDGILKEKPSNNVLDLHYYKFTLGVEHNVKIYSKTKIVVQPFEFDFTIVNKEDVIYKKNNLTIKASDYSNATYATVGEYSTGVENGEFKIDISSLAIGELGEIYLYTEKQIYCQKIVKVDTIISTPQELLEFNRAIKNKTVGKYIVLANDVDATGLGCFSLKLTGSSDYNFESHFNGLGHTISNLEVSQGGLFGTTKVGSVIENVAFLDCVCNDKKGYIIGHGYGGIVQNVYVNISFTNADAVGGAIRRPMQFKNVITDVSFENHNSNVQTYVFADYNLFTEFDSSTRNNVLAISNIADTKIALNDATLGVGKIYSTESALIDEQASNVEKWGGYWSVSNGEIYFSGIKVVAK